MPETKLTAGAVASGLLPAVMLVASLVGWDVVEADVSAWLYAAATVAIPAVTFAAGWFRRSTTSRVSDAYEPGRVVVQPPPPPPPSEAGYGLIEILLAVFLIIVIVFVLLRVL